MERKRQYIAPDDVLKSHNCSVILSSNDDPNSAQPCGIRMKLPNSDSDWEITSHAGNTIATGGELDEWTSDFVEKAKRKLCLPEIIFTKSHVTLSQGDNDTPILQYKAYDALMEWAACHEHLHDKEEYRGVSIVQTADAALWASKNKQQSTSSDTKDDDKNNNSQNKNHAELHYDWTFSTPFIGTTKPIKDPQQQTNQNDTWTKNNQSGLSWATLRDTSQPILFFDEVCLYEDDLHDNGCTSCTVKIRVMPSCLFMLYQLKVRVDNVLMRTREVRHFLKFDDDPKQPPAKLYRELTWRQSSWNQLMPRGIQPWRWEDISSFYDENALEREQKLQRLLQQLKRVAVCDDIPLYASLEL